MIKKTYIPSKPRNPKLGTATGASGVGKTEFNQVAGSSHEHYNKGVLDQITEAMLVGALRDLITSADTETELTDENILSSLRVLSEITKNNETFLEDLKERFLSKIEPDTAQKLITFIEGIEVGAFTTGALGSGAAIKMLNGTSYAEVDHLTVRQKATFRELIIESLKHIGGQLVLTPARMKCVRVVDGGTYYKCYFDTGEGEVSNEFVAGDLARCQVFTGNGTKFYWRLVTLVGDDWINLSKTSAAVGSDAPEAGDDIAQLGNATDTSRQSAIILSTVGIDAPSWKQYSGINSFSLEGKETTVFSKLGNKIDGKTVFTSGGANLDDHLDGVAQDILDALKAAQDAEDKAQQAIEDAEANVATINTEIGRLQDQIDGKVSNWYYPYSPTLANYPASDWTTDEIKDAHVGDTFTNTEPAPAENAGKSWRFIKNGSTYSWTVISDSDALKALLEASKAQATADGKSTTYLFQPTKYNLGDMWVLNADLTVNGTAYKQGDLLTATQDSETFVQSHWLKRVRYTDDTKIDELEIGGRNLIIRSSEEVGTYVNSYGDIVPVASHSTTDYIKVEPNKTYSFSKIPSVLVPEGIGGYWRYAWYDEDKVYISRTAETSLHNLQWTIPSNAHYVRLSYPIDSQPKLEKGNKPTDWSEAPEDTQARINSAKQEALDASNNVQTNVNSLNTYVTGAFKDGVIDEAEARAIEKYKNTINETMVKAEASFLKVFANTYLEGTAKTALENAKINLWGQRDTLLSTINNAIADGKTTIAKKNAVDSAFNIFNSLMSAFQNALEEANKAIQKKLDDIAKGYVDNLEIGGRNLIIKGTLLDATYLLQDTGALASSPTHMATDYIPVIEGVEYIMSAPAIAQVRIVYYDASNIYISGALYAGLQGEKKIIHTPPLTAFVRISADKSAGTPLSGNWKFEKGNKATDWTLAPEDELISTRNLWLNTATPIVSGNLTIAASRNLTSFIPDGTEVTIEFDIDVTLGYNLIIYQTNLTNIVWDGTGKFSTILNTNLNTGKQRIKQTFIYDSNAGEKPYIVFYKNTVTASTTTITKLMLGEGNKVAWSEAPEDVQARINAADGKAAEALAKANTSKAVTDKFSGFDGGLATAVIMEMREPSTTTRGDATAFISGMQGALKNLPAFGAGGTYADAIAGIAKAIIYHDGRVKFEEAEITGTVNALEGSIGGLSLEGKKLFSQNHKLQIDGEEATIALLDPNTDTLRTIIRPTNITTSVASYFASSSISPVLIAGIKANYTKTIWNLATSSMTLNATGGKTFEVSIPAFSVTMGVTHPGGAGIGSVYARTAVYLTNGSSMKQPLTSLASIITSTGGTFSKTDSYPAQKVVITNSGSYRLLVELTHSPEAVSPNGQLSSTATNFTASEVVNRSEIGSNGVVIATSNTNYSFMVGDIFEVRRGNSGLRITNSGIQKWNGTSWVTANI